MDARSKIVEVDLIGSERRWHAPLNVETNALAFAQLSFSLGGEDAVLVRHFKQQVFERRPGVYVDVGCAWPVLGSNTYLFSCLGWSGIGIDLNAFHKREWAKIRPRDIFIAAAISDDPKPVTISMHRDNGGQIQLGEPPSSDFSVHGVMRPKRLEDVLDSVSAPSDIDLMSIDVEASEMGVLASNNWDKYSPRVIIMECWDFKFGEPAPAAVSFLLERGYIFTDSVGSNVILRQSSP